MALAAELRRRLSTADLGPPEKRLRLAVKIFESPHVRVPRKEEAVIEALCRQESWDALRECLRSDQFVRVSLRPTIRKKLVQVAAKDAESGRLLLHDLQTSNYLAARPQEFHAMCKTLFLKPDILTLKAAVSCARRSPAPLSLAPFFTSLSEIEVDDESVQQLASVISNGQEILDHLKDKVSPKTVGLASRVIAAKYGKRDSKTEEFIVALIASTKNDEESIGIALATIESVENREWLSKLFDSCLSKNKPKKLIAAFRPLAKLDFLLFESLIPRLMGHLVESSDLDDLLTESLSAAEKEQRPHKLVSKVMEGMKSEEAPTFVRFPKALGLSALSWPSKILAAAITGLLFHLESKTDCAFFSSTEPLLSSLLKASKAAQHNTPDLVRDKFMSILLQASTVLEKYASMAESNDSEPEFLSAYLRVCSTYAEMKLLFLHYYGDQENARSVGLTLLDFSLLLPFVSNWPALANKALAHENCRCLIATLVDQTVRATTLLELEMNKEQQEAAALMLASCSMGHLSTSLELLTEKLKKSTLTKVVDLLAASFLQSPNRTFSDYFDSHVALALLRAMKEKDIARGVLGNMTLKQAETPCDAMSAPDVKPKGEVLQFVRAFGQLHLTDHTLRLLSATSLLAACHGMKNDWSEAIPVFIRLLCDLERKFDMDKLLAWINKASVDANNDLLDKFACALFQKEKPTVSNLAAFKKPLKPLAVSAVKYFMTMKLDSKLQECLRKNAQDNEIKVEASSLYESCSNVSSATPEQLTELIKSKAAIDAFTADAIFTRMLQFDLKDVRTLKATALCLNAFITSRGALTVDRLAVVQLKLQSICLAVIEAQDDETTAEVAHLIEGMGVAMARYKKDFARVAPYYAADVLGLFESKSIHPSVKVHFERYLQSLLRLCDEHGELFLLRASTPACQQMLHAQLAEKKKTEKYV
ncbi:Hypothetical predicted protein [Cloeon dipterum]|uniref:Uncharacterized protein n=1 Tax=Cloeon dipterum TaxID=197152 RepID=A0A8S1DF66_9INSE|nr:Hypothetical predicted protein [Cloeon dipterum]